MAGERPRRPPISAIEAFGFTEVMREGDGPATLYHAVVRCRAYAGRHALRYYPRRPFFGSAGFAVVSDGVVFCFAQSGALTSMCKCPSLVSSGCDVARASASWCACAADVSCVPDAGRRVLGQGEEYCVCRAGGWHVNAVSLARRVASRPALFRSLG